MRGAWTRQIDPDTVVDLDPPLERAAGGDRAMDRRGAIEVLRRP